MSQGEHRSGRPHRESPRRRPAGTAALLACCLAWAAAAPAQFPVDEGPQRAATSVYFDTSNAADALLRSAANHVRGGHFAEAVEIYQRVIQQFGDKVVETADEPASPGLAGLSHLSIDVRRECQRRIAALPPEGRALYRARVDGQAERWYRQGEAGRDRAPLRRVIDQAFCSSWGDDALELLGDLAFQDGQFAEALSQYGRLRPDRAGAGSAFTHPDPSVDLARVDAKKLLARAALGENPPTAEEIRAFAEANPQAAGPFAGRRGLLARDLAEAIRDDHLAQSSAADGRWPTFAGSPSRSRVAPHPIDVGSLQWRVELEPINGQVGRPTQYNRISRMIPTTPPTPERLLAYHPIVVGDQVIVDDSRQVIAYNLNGRPADPAGATTPAEVAWKIDKQAQNTPPFATRAYQGLARHTLTAFGDRVYTRIGPPPSTIPMTGRNGGINIGPPTPSSILALDRGGEGKRAWETKASDITLPKRRADNSARNVVFEGTPVADARGVYVALTDRVEMTAAYVACLDAEDGHLRWLRSVCEASGGGGDIWTTGIRNEIGLRLLTLEGSTLYFQTNLGALAAVDAETGSIRWLATYPTRRAPNSYDRDLNPAIVHDGLVIIAPNDAPGIYAFDAATGRMAWKTDDVPEEVHLAHLLGVAKGKLVATGDRVLLYDVKTGKLARVWPENNQATQGYGRGVLAGDRIYWPTKNEIHVLDQETGLRSDPPIRLQETFGCEGGNLAVGDGYLLVAQSNALVVFCQTSRLIERYKAEIARAPDRAANYYRLAQVSEAVGRDDEALSSLERIAALDRTGEMIDGLPVADQARDQRRRLLMKLGGKAKAERRWAQAVERYESADAVARTDRDRLAARLELAEVQAGADRPGDSVRTLQAILADDRLRSLSIAAGDDHRSVRADLLVADRLAGLLGVRGRDLYADYDRDAARLLDRGVRARDPRLIEDVGRSYPAARVVPDAWLALARLREEAGQPGEAARAYKRLLAAAPDDAGRARALWGLGHAYEAQKLWVSARDVYLLASARFADQPIDGAGGEAGRLGPLVADRLGRDPFARMRGDQVGPGAPVPLRRRWDLHPASDIRPIAADGVPPASGVGRIFLAQGRTLRPVDPQAGTSAWVADLGGEPAWVGYLADRIIAATATSLVALDPATGKVDWKRAIEPPASEPEADPFGRAVTGDPADPLRRPAHLAGFRVVGNRIFCLQGDRSLLAHDGDTGLLDWSYTPAPGSRINSRMLVGPGRIVLQSLRPNRTLILDTATGRRLGDFAGEDGAEAWPLEPLAIDDDHAAIVLDRDRVGLLDLNRGVLAWTVRSSEGLPRVGPVRLIGDGERLLLLDGRNLARLDPASGAERWRRSLGGEDLSERPDAVAVAGDRIFVANNAKLSAYGLADGSPAWVRELLHGPDQGWAVALVDRAVAAYPNPARMPEGSAGALPLLLHRRDDGRLAQRFVFQAAAPDLAVLASPLGALVASRGGLWALGDHRVMDGAARPE